MEALAAVMSLYLQSSWARDASESVDQCAFPGRSPVLEPLNAFFLVDMNPLLDDRLERWWHPREEVRGASLAPVTELRERDPGVPGGAVVPVEITLAFTASCTISELLVRRVNENSPAGETR